MTRMHVLMYMYSSPNSKGKQWSSVGPGKADRRHFKLSKAIILRLAHDCSLAIPSGSVVHHFCVILPGVFTHTAS